jgi:hypothetical protein
VGVTHHHGSVVLGLSSPEQARERPSTHPTTGLYDALIRNGRQNRDRLTRLSQMMAISGRRRIFLHRNAGDSSE